MFNIQLNSHPNHFSFYLSIYERDISPRCNCLYRQFISVFSCVHICFRPGFFSCTWIQVVLRITPGDLCVPIVGAFEKSRCFYNLVHGRTVSESTSQKETFFSLLNLMHFALGQPFSVGKKKIAFMRSIYFLLYSIQFTERILFLNTAFFFFTKGTSEMIKHKIHFEYYGFSVYIRLAV